MLINKYPLVCHIIDQCMKIDKWSKPGGKAKLWGHVPHTPRRNATESPGNVFVVQKVRNRAGSGQKFRPVLSLQHVSA